MRREQILLPVLRALIARPRVLALAFARDPWGNPFADDVVDDPSGYIARMWEDGPVSYSKTFRRWFVIGYEECQFLANHPGASAGATMHALLADVRPYSKLAGDSKDFFLDWMLARDGDDHRRIRKLVSSAFTPKRVAELEPRIAAIVDDLLDGIADRDTFDIVPTFTRPLPHAVICTMLGIPGERRDRLGRLIADIGTFFDPFTKFEPDRIDEAITEFRSEIIELADQRLDTPRDDLITALARANEDGDRLTPRELVANVGLLIFAGNDTTSNVLGNALIALAKHPDQRAKVRDDPSLWPNAVEELLRFDTTAVAIARDTSTDITVGDVTIPAGSGIQVQLNAANRDPRRWDGPEDLRLDRPDPRPISFGHGAHHCLGHALARLELRLGLRALLDDLGDYAVEAVDWRLSPNLRGPTSLTLRRPPARHAILPATSN